MNDDLFSYPHSPGHRGIDTSIVAAADVVPTAKTVQAKVLRAIRAAGDHGLTTNECAALLRLERDTVQPRTSELRSVRLIMDSGKRRPNANGKRAIVWVAVDPPVALAA